MAAQRNVGAECDRVQRESVGHLLAKRRECAHCGDADEGEGAEAHGALPRLREGSGWVREVVG